MKKGDARRGELLATAERLFYTKGYEKTSVQDILTEMNFSKGGFDKKDSFERKDFRKESDYNRTHNNFKKKDNK